MPSVSGSVLALLYDKVKKLVSESRYFFSDLAQLGAESADGSLYLVCVPWRDVDSPGRGAVELFWLGS